MIVKVSRPVAWYIVLSIIVTWMAEKLQALPDYLNWFGLGYWIMLVILVGLSLLPSTKVVKPNG